MPGFNPEKLNIHDLTIEEPEKESSDLFFDPEKYITQEDLESMQKTQKKYANGKWKGHWPNDFSRYIQQLTAMRILGFPIELSKRGRTELESNLNLSGTYNELFRYASIEKVPLKTKIIENELKMLKDYAENGEWENFSQTSSSLILTGKKLNITPEEIDEIYKSIEYFFDRGNGGVERAIELASFLRIIKKNFKLPVKMLETAKERLDVLHNQATDWKKPSHWLSFSKYASHLAILSADEVRIPPGGGLELVYNKEAELQSETSQMPEQRNF